MSRLLPKSLLGQTLLILLVGLIISHAVGSWIYTTDREQAVRTVGGFAAAQRIANLARLVRDAPAEWQPRIVAALNDQTFRVALLAEPPALNAPIDGPPVAEAIKAYLIEQLSLGSLQQPRVSASLTGGPPFGWHPMMGRGPMMHGLGPFGTLGGFGDLQVAVPLPLVRDRLTRERPIVLASVPPVHGAHGDHYSCGVSVGCATRDRPTRNAFSRGRTARQ